MFPVDHTRGGLSCNSCLLLLCSMICGIPFTKQASYKITTLWQISSKSLLLYRCQWHHSWYMYIHVHVQCTMQLIQVHLWSDYLGTYTTHMYCYPQDKQLVLQLAFCCSCLLSVLSCLVSGRSIYQASPFHLVWSKVISTVFSQVITVLVSQFPCFPFHCPSLSPQPCKCLIVQSLSHVRGSCMVGLLTDLLDIT